MNITQLKYFYEVSRCRSVTAAAENMHISQPTVSNSIKELENEFGITLFRRHHRGMILTPEGEVFFGMCEDILKRTEHIGNIMKDMGNGRKTLRLGVPPMIGSLVLPKIYREFLAENDDISLDITEGGSHELSRMLADDYLDMIFLPYNNPLEAGWGSLTVAKYEIVCCASEESTLADYKSVCPQDLKDTPVVMFDNAFFQTDKINRWFSDGGVTPKTVFRTRQLSTVQSMVAGNAASGFMFREIADTTAGVVSIPLESPIYEDISLVWKTGTYSLECMAGFRKYIKDRKPFSNERGRMSFDTQR